MSNSLNEYSRFLLILWLLFALSEFHRLKCYALSEGSTIIIRFVVHPYSVLDGTDDDSLCTHRFDASTNIYSSVVSHDVILPLFHLDYLIARRRRRRRCRLKPIALAQNKWCVFTATKTEGVSLSFTYSARHCLSYSCICSSVRVLVHRARRTRADLSCIVSHRRKMQCE